MSFVNNQPILALADVTNSSINQVQVNQSLSESEFFKKHKFKFPTEKVGYLLNQKLQVTEEITNKELNSLVFIMFDHILSLKM